MKILRNIEADQYKRPIFLRAIGSTFSFFSKPNRKKVIPVLVVSEFLNFKKGESLNIRTTYYSETLELSRNTEPNRIF